MRLGIDVGGTNTDAVLVAGRTVLASAKRPTTSDVSSGIVSATRAVLEAASEGTAAIDSVMIGTTHFANAFVERKGLLEVAVLRLAGAAGEALPPMSGWPDDLRRCIGNATFQLPGGYEFDGRENTAFDERAVRDVARKVRQAGLGSVAISCVFSPINRAMEERAAAIVREEVPGISITMSSALGRIGFLERENATIMNAALALMAGRVMSSFAGAFAEMGIRAPLYVSQNDGTLISSEYAARYPVLTFGSGPTNSMRGAAFLTGIQDAIVMDVGGTTTDIGALVNGFPRESSIAVDIGGVRTNFRMPDILSLGLGGGTRIHGATSPKELQIGPDSVGYRLLEEGCLFGGSTLTASDIAVKAGYASFGDVALVPDLPPGVLEAILLRFRRIFEEGIDRMKTAAVDVPVVLVGGGSVLVEKALKGASQVLQPQHAAVANAVGAAIAQVGGEVDRIVAYEKVGRAQALKSIEQEATDRAIAAGADPGSVHLVDVEEVFLSYLPGKHRAGARQGGRRSGGGTVQPVKVTARREARYLLREDVADLARGCAFLGSGGGGDPHTVSMEIDAALASGGRIELIELDALADDAFVAPCGWIGAPTVSAEKLPSGREALQGLRKLEEISARRVDAVFPVEIGGSNGLAALLLALRAGLPVVDCDGMGRAFPESQMVMFNIRGQRAAPAVLTDDKGNCVVVETQDNLTEERLARAISVAMGGICHLVEYSATGKQMKESALRGTISDALAIGRSIRIAREKGRDPFAALFDALRSSTQFGLAGVLFDGKIVDLHRETRNGFSVGRAVIDAFGGGSRLEVEFKNENLVARLDGEVRALVPDLITVLDRETAETIVTERLKYGQRVKVVGASAPAALCSPEALAVLGPGAFDLPAAYRPIAEFNGWSV